MTDKRKNIVLRFGIVYIIVCLSFFLVLYRIIIIQFVERDKWLALAAQNVKSNIVVKPNRGNIYACDGRLMASSIPTYYVYMDLRVPALHEKNGVLFKNNIDSLSICRASFGIKLHINTKPHLQELTKPELVNCSCFPTVFHTHNSSNSKHYHFFGWEETKAD